MRRIVLFVFCTVMLLALTGCGRLAYPEYICPDYDSDEVWVAKEVKMFFKFEEDAGCYVGLAISSDGIKTSIADGGYISGDTLEITRYPRTAKSRSEDVVLLGWLQKSDMENELSMLLDPGDNKLYPDLEEITWHIYAASEVEWVDGWPVPIEG